MSRLYCTLSETKRLLRSVGAQSENKIRFSDVYKELKADSSNNGTISLSGVVFSNAFAAHETFSFEFTDSTSFDVVGDIVGFLGSGTVTSKFSSTNRFTVPIANWSGSAQTGDIWYITSNSDISEDDGDSFIEDACMIIDAELDKKFGGLDRVPFLVDVSLAVPDAIKFACIRLSAYEIFNSVYSAIGVDEDSPVEKWKTSGYSLLAGYIESHGQGPVWQSRGSLITDLGIKSIGEGEIEIDSLTDAHNKEYDR